MNTSSRVPLNFTRLKRVDTEIVNARRDDDIAECKVCVGDSTSNADHQQKRGRQVLNHIISKLLGRLWTLLLTTFYSNGSVFSILRLYLADSIVASARTTLWSRVKAASKCLILILSHGNNSEIGLHCDLSYLHTLAV